MLKYAYSWSDEAYLKENIKKWFIDWKVPMNIFHTAESLYLDLLIFLLYARRAHEVSLSQDEKKKIEGEKN